MSDTPRTDELLARLDKEGEGDFQAVLALTCHAQTLERELAAAMKKLQDEN